MAASAEAFAVDVHDWSLEDWLWDPEALEALPGQAKPSTGCDSRRPLPQLEANGQIKSRQKPSRARLEAERVLRQVGRTRQSLSGCHSRLAPPPSLSPLVKAFQKHLLRLNSSTQLCRVTCVPFCFPLYTLERWRYRTQSRHSLPRRWWCRTSSSWGPDRARRTRVCWPAARYPWCGKANGTR